MDRNFTRRAVVANRKDLQTMGMDSLIPPDPKMAGKVYSLSTWK